MANSLFTLFDDTLVGGEGGGEKSEFEIIKSGISTPEHLSKNYFFVFNNCQVLEHFEDF